MDLRQDVVVVVGDHDAKRQRIIGALRHGEIAVDRKFGTAGGTYQRYVPNIPLRSDG